MIQDAKIASGSIQPTRIAEITDPAARAMLRQVADRGRAIVTARERCRRKHPFLRILGWLGVYDFDQLVRESAYAQVYGKEALESLTEYRQSR